MQVFFMRDITFWYNILMFCIFLKKGILVDQQVVNGLLIGGICEHFSLTWLFWNWKQNKAKLDQLKKNLKETAEVRLMFSYIFASSYSGQCFAFQPIKTVQYFEKKQKKRYLLSIATTVNPIRVFLVKCELEKQLFEQKESKFVYITFVIFSSSSKTEYDKVQRNISRITHRHILSFLNWI